MQARQVNDGDSACRRETGPRTLRSYGHDLGHGELAFACPTAGHRAGGCDRYQTFVTHGAFGGDELGWLQSSTPGRYGASPRT
jgi:hypothetical protein